jgi:osmotically-inducible protein OsmY
VPDSVQAEVRDGWVTLRGEVDSNYQRHEAERAAANTRGVTGVTNRIAVTPSTAPDVSDVHNRTTTDP